MNDDFPLITQTRSLRVNLSSFRAEAVATGVGRDLEGQT